MQKLTFGGKSKSQQQTTKVNESKTNQSNTKKESFKETAEFQGKEKDSKQHLNIPQNIAMLGPNVNNSKHNLSNAYDRKGSIDTRKYSIVSFAQESLILNDARRQSLGKKKQQPFGIEQRDDSKEIDDKSHNHFDVGNSHLKLISAQALQQKTRQLSVCVYSDKFTTELRESLTPVQEGITQIKQAPQLSPR